MRQPIPGDLPGDLPGDWPGAESRPELPMIKQLRQQATDATCIRQREHRGYSLFHISQDLVYKRYHFPQAQSLSPAEREWETEHSIMQQLADVAGVPISYGFRIEQAEGEQRFHCLRQYIKGEAVDGFSVDEARWLARFFAVLHRRGITTNDPQLKNFVRTPHGQLYCVDFGKGRCFSARTPGYYWLVARELFDIRRCALEQQSTLWLAFSAEYRQHQAFSGWEKMLIGAGFTALVPHRAYRNAIKKRRKAARKSQRRRQQASQSQSR